MNFEEKTVFSGTLLNVPLSENVTIISKPDFMHVENGQLLGIPVSNIDEFFITYIERNIQKKINFKLSHINHNKNFYDGYMKYGYSSKLYEYAPLKGKFTYDISINPIKQTYENACKDAANIAKFLSNQANLELCLFLSGGVDSEAMALAFLNSNIKFTPFIIQMNNNLNDYDIKYALEFCKTYNIVPKIFNFDPIKFIDLKEHYYYGLKYRSRYVEIQMILKALDSHPEIFPVFPANIPFVVSKDNTTSFNLLIDQFHSIYRYLYLNQRPGIENYFYYTSDQYASAVLSPIYYAFLFGKNMDYYDKVSVYNYFGFNVLPKPRKYTGWEKTKYMFAKKYFDETGIWNDDYFFQKANLKYLDKFLQMEYKWPSSINFN